MSDPTHNDLPADSQGDRADDQAFEEYLRGGSAVSRQYRQLRSADVPAELDRLVLRQAQDAVKVRPTKSRAWLRWTGPLALAASAVLVISIVIESGVRKETYLTVPASAPVETQVIREAEQSAVVEDKATAGDAAASAPVAPIVPVDPGPQAKMRLEPAPMRAAPVPEPAPAQEYANEPVTVLRAAPPPAAAPAPEPAAPAMKVEMPPPEVQRRMEAISQRHATEPAQTTAQSLDLHANEHELESAVVTADKRRSLGDEEAARTVQDSLREQARVAGPRNTVAAPAAPATNSAGQEAEPRNYSDPEQWLRDIRALRKENKHAEADREWRRFRSVFPNYAVAEDDPVRRAVP